MAGRLASVETRNISNGDMRATGVLLDATLGAGFWVLDPGSLGSHRVAVLDGRIVGAVSACIGAAAPDDLGLDPPVCVIRAVAVDPLVRGRGLATRLVSEACVECDRLGAMSFVAFCWVHGSDGDAPLAGPLERLGFIRGRRIEGFYSGAGLATCPHCDRTPCACPADVYWRKAGSARSWWVGQAHPDRRGAQR